MGIKTNLFGGKISSCLADINGVYGSLYTTGTHHASGEGERVIAPEPW